MNVQSPDEKYMQMALKLAARGIGRVEPNPAVGCVIVKNDRIIGKGWHRKFGQAHAEINALKDCKVNGIDPADATVYVTLEPCCHKGKTGPCTGALIKAKIQKVVIAALDPSEEVGGKGARRLQDAGIAVETGIYQQQKRY